MHTNSQLKTLRDIDIDLSIHKTQAIKTSKLRKVLKVAKLFNVGHIHFLNNVIVIGNNRDIVIKLDYNGDSMVFNTIQINIILELAKIHQLKTLFFVVMNNNESVYLAVSGNKYIVI